MERGEYVLWCQAVNGPTALFFPTAERLLECAAWVDKLGIGSVVIQDEKTMQLVMP